MATAVNARKGEWEGMEQNAHDIYDKLTPDIKLGLSGHTTE